MFPCIRPDDMRYDHFSLTGSRHTVRQALPTPTARKITFATDQKYCQRRDKDRI